MEKKRPSPNGIESRYKLNPNDDVIIDADITEYELKNHPSEVYFTGKIYFKDGREKDVRFFKFKDEDLAKKIITRTSKTNQKGVGVLKVYFATYNESHKLWILCYDWFDFLLHEFMDHKDLKTEIIDDSSLILSNWWRDEISDVLRTIKDLHFSGFYHKGLNKSCNYVVVSEKIKIVNIQGSFEDVEDPITPTKIWKLRIDDLKAFRDLLKNEILLPGDSWAERDGFCDFFDNENFPYTIFVKKLEKHPFLLNCGTERMMSFDVLWADLKNDDTLMTKFQKILDNSDEFKQYKGWNKLRMVAAFQRIYYYKDPTGQHIFYNGQSVLHLLRFLRNVKVHHKSQGISIEDADLEVGKLYPNFLNKLYTLLI